MKFLFRKKVAAHFQSGFTLIEMLAVIAIIGLLMYVVVFNQSKFQSDIEITNVAYRIALEVRQAQVYGISVRQAVGSSFNVAYGVHFNKQVSPNTHFIFYSDELDPLSNPYNKYIGSPDSDCNGTLGCVEQGVIGRGNEIKQICAIGGAAQGDNDPSCYSPDNLYALDITFKRPNPDAIFNAYTNNYTGSPVSNSGICNGTECAGWKICLESPLGRRKKVVVLSTGQISVEDAQNDNCLTAGNDGSGDPGFGSQQVGGGGGTSG